MNQVSVSIMRRTITFSEQAGLYVAENAPALVDMDGVSGVASGDGSVVIYVPHKIRHVRQQAARKLRRWLLHKFLPSVYVFRLWALVRLNHQASCVVNGAQYCFLPTYAHLRVMVYPSQPEPLFRLLQRPMGPFIQPTQIITLES